VNIIRWVMVVREDWKIAELTDTGVGKTFQGGKEAHLLRRKKKKGLDRIYYLRVAGKGSDTEGFLFGVHRGDIENQRKQKRGGGQKNKKSI